MKRKVIVPCSILGVALIVAGYFIYIRPACENISCLSFNNSAEYTLHRTYEKGHDIFRGLYMNGETLLRAEIRSNFSTEEADKAVALRIGRMKGLFEDAAAPYPGALSDIISCGETYKPEYSTRTHKNTTVHYFKGFVNDRLVFGSCTSDQAVYHDTLAMFYCEKQKKFYQLELMAPTKQYSENPEQYEEVLNSIVCK